MTARKGGDRPRVRPGEHTAAILRGEVDVTAWDDEELRRGRRRNKHGTFYGRRSQARAPPGLRRATAAHRNRVRGDGPARAGPGDAGRGGHGQGQGRPGPPRLKVAQEIINRFAGKAPERVDITHHGERAYEQVLRGGIVRDLPDDEDVVDAELVEDDE